MTTMYTVTVDTEEQWQWDDGWPTGSPCVSNIDRIGEFQQICARHGAAVTYFANYAVLDDDRARSHLLAIADQPRVEIGMHIHPWNTPPILDFRSVQSNESFLTNVREDLVLAKLTTVYRRFLQHSLTPTSFRGGRYSTGGIVHSFLREKQFLADASIVPFTSWTDNGAPDYRHNGLTPIRHPPQYGQPPLWEIPLTLGFSRRPFQFWRYTFDAIENSPLRRLRLIGIADRLNLVRRVWLNFEDPLGHHMLSFLKTTIRRLELPCICFTLHSSSLEVGANGYYTHNEQERNKLLQRVEEALALVAGWSDFEPVTITEAARRLEEQHYARAGN